MPVDVPAGTPLAGYGAFARRLALPDVLGRHPHAFWFTPHTGVRDPLAVRALVLEGAGRRIVWLAVELIAVDRGFTAAVARRLGVDPTRDALIVSASHTHSGPGAFLESEVMAFVATDRQDRQVREALLAAVADAVRRAERTKRAARVGAITIPGPDVTVPRLQTSPDRELLVMKVAGDDGRPVALLWNFAIHGTTLSARNLELSGDVMGRVSRDLERLLGIPALYVNGAVGDVSPRGHGPEAAAALSERLTAAVAGTWPPIDAGDARPPAFARDTVPLNRPALPLRNCIGRWWPRALTLPLGQVFPDDAHLVAASTGTIAWVTVPGELQSVLGLRIKDAGRARFRHTFVAGLSNDYLGYFVRAEDWDQVSYVTCATVHGARAGEHLTERAGALLERLDRSVEHGTPAATETSGRRR